MFSEQQILQSRNPDEYITRCLHSKVPRGRKATLCKEWLSKTKWTVEDIKYARHRHPYWKKLKLKGSKRRTEIRFKKYDYSYRPQYHKARSRREMEHFIEMNKKNVDGKYTYTDRELAAIFSTTIPGIQSWRRKLNLSIQILKHNNKNVTTNNIMKYFLKGENQLRELFKKEKFKRGRRPK